MSQFWLSLLSNIIEGVIVYFAGYLGGYKVAKWRLEKEIAIKHLEDIKTRVIRPLIRILNLNVRAFLEHKHSNIERDWETISDEYNTRVGTKYDLKINDGLHCLSRLRPCFGENLDWFLLHDLENHFMKIRQKLDVVSNLETYNRKCLNFAGLIRAKLDSHCRDMGFEEQQIAKELSEGSSLLYVNTPFIAQWVYRVLFGVEANRLVIEPVGNDFVLYEHNGPRFARADKTKIENISSFAYYLTKWQNEDVGKLKGETFSLLGTIQDLESSLDILEKSNRLPGICEYIRI